MFLGEWGFPPVGVAVRSKKMFLCFHGLWNIVIQCDTISIRFYTCNGWLTLTLDLFNAWVFPCGIGIFSARIASTRHQESGLSLQLHNHSGHAETLHADTLLWTPKHSQRSLSERWIKINMTIVQKISYQWKQKHGTLETTQVLI